MAGPPQPATTVAILLGASEFPFAKFDPAPQFQTSAKDVCRYLLAPSGLALPSRNVLDLFDIDDEAPGILRKIATFLEERCATLRKLGSRLTDLIIYYVGHGGFDWRENSAYFLAIRKTDASFQASSSLAIAPLRRVLMNHAEAARKYLILDCCFAGYAARSFILQSAPAQAMALQVETEFPASGTALLCAASAGVPARTLPSGTHTMFSAALLEILWQGVPGKNRTLSLSELGDAVRLLLNLRHLDEAYH